jgi:hypothetical protein
MQLAVPSAVSAAVSAAIAMRSTASQKPFFFIRFKCLIQFSEVIASLEVIEVNEVNDVSSCD